MNSKQSIEEAATGFAQNVNPELYHYKLDISWLIFKLVEFSLSDAAKEYWFQVFKAQEQKPVWVKASERLPEERGKKNSVVIKWNGCVAYGFRNFDEETPKMYFEINGKSYLTNDGVEWLDEQPKQPLTDEAIEALAEKEYPYLNGDGLSKIQTNVQRATFIKGFQEALKLK